MSHPYQSLIHDLPVGMAILQLTDPRDQETWELAAINSIASRVVGSSVAQLLSLPITTASSLEGPRNLANIFRRVVFQRKSKRLGHIRVAGASASREFYLATVCPLEGNCIAIVLQDATRLNETLRQLSEVESQIRQMSDSARAILWRAEPSTLRFTYVTAHAQEILGYWIERWLHETNFWKNHGHPDDWDVVESRCAESVRAGSKQQFDCRMIATGGEVRWFRVHVHPQELRSGRVELVGAMVDITDQKMAAEVARDLSSAVMRGQERERESISKELHEGIGQHLAALNYGLASLRDDGLDSSEAREKFEECIDLVKTCIDEIRSISYNLRPPLLDLMGLAPALRSYAEGFSRQSGIRLELVFAEGIERLDADTEMALFRVAQECLANIERHARAHFACVRLSMDAHALLMEVEDHGIGAEPRLLERLELGTAGPGTGLLKMRERVAYLKGELCILSGATGTTVRVKIPRNSRQTASRVQIDGAVITLVDISRQSPGGDTLEKVVP